MICPLDSVRNVFFFRSTADLHPSKPIRERFPPPWTVVEFDVGIRVCDAEGKWVTWVYCEDEEVRKGILRLPTRAEARSIAAVVARLAQKLEDDASAEVLTFEDLEIPPGEVEDYIRDIIVHVGEPVHTLQNYDQDDKNRVNLQFLLTHSQ